ncbi:MAG: YbjN domain-containing protein [Alphaproteobacteria bacterium]|nr:YbjN domain-containing protein [Alphaproteobacteria bacterium]
MNLARALHIGGNPIDEIEDFLNTNAYTPERRSQNEIVVEIQGKWNDMLLFFSFEENMRCLHISCLMNIENQIVGANKIYELLAMINDDIWVGHFSYWMAEKMPVYRHSIFYDEHDDRFKDQIAKIVNIAVKECERMYPIFNVVLTKGMEPSQALYPLLMETSGQA